MQHARYIGLDVHKQFAQAAVLSCSGELLVQQRFPSTPEAIGQFAATLTRDDAVALESTTNALAFHRLLSEHAGRVVISNPLKTKIIAEGKIKTDKVDARTLADLLRADFLPTVWVPDDATGDLRAQAAYRLALVRERTRIKNRIHSLLHRNLVTPPRVTDLFGPTGRAFLGEVSLPPRERRQLDRELHLLEDLGGRITVEDRELARQAEKRPETRLLLSLPGVSVQTAAGIVAAVGDIHRFPSPERLVSYFGLDPKARSSADKPVGGSGISHQGRGHARWLLIEAAHTAVRVPGPLQAFFLRLRGKKNYNVAIVAVARKLALFIWHILTKGEPYRWAPPVRTHEKAQKLERLAGKAVTRGEWHGQYAAIQKEQWALAQHAQQLYEELVRSRASSPPRGARRRA